jgi:hypothetical protein
MQAVVLPDEHEDDLGPSLAIRYVLPASLLPSKNLEWAAGRSAERRRTDVKDCRRIPVIG